MPAEPAKCWCKPLVIPVVGSPALSQEVGTLVLLLQGEGSPGALGNQEPLGILAQEVGILAQEVGIPADKPQVELGSEGTPLGGRNLQEGGKQGKQAAGEGRLAEFDPEAVAPEEDK